MTNPDPAGPPPFTALLAGGWRSLPFTPFRPGVGIHRLWPGSGESAPGPQLALLQYEPGASVPRHRHEGLETILVLEGEQSDDRGRYTSGDVICNPPGTEHRVWSATGCTVLILWERPVTILE